MIFLPFVLSACYPLSLQLGLFVAMLKNEYRQWKRKYDVMYGYDRVKCSTKKMFGLVCYSYEIGLFQVSGGRSLQSVFKTVK